MDITAISDLHGYLPTLPGGDLLIMAGDYTSSDKISQWAEFFSWLEKQKYSKKVLVGGNHDNLLESAFPKTLLEANDLAEIKGFLREQGEEIEDFDYLCDSGCEYEGLKIWGSPWTHTFTGVNPHCKAFMIPEDELEAKWQLIPDGTDILVCHSPFLHMLDQNREGYACGSRSLREAVERVKPRLFVCGHIHEQGGRQMMYKHAGTNTWCVNASYVDGDYEPANEPIRLTI